MRNIMARKYGTSAYPKPIGGMNVPEVEHRRDAAFIVIEDRYGRLSVRRPASRALTSILPETTASGAGSAAVIPPTARAGSHAYTALAIPQRERCAANAPAPIRRSNHLAHRPHQSAMRSSALATLSILAASAAP